MSDLKPCPFCGAYLLQCDVSPIYGKSAVHPTTDKCWLSNYLLWEVQFESWNTRPIDDALNAELTKLREDNKLMYDTYMKSNHEFGLVMQYASEIVKLREDNKSLIEQVNEAGEKHDNMKHILDTALECADNEDLIMCRAYLRKWKLEATNE